MNSKITNINVKIVIFIPFKKNITKQYPIKIIILIQKNINDSSIFRFLFEYLMIYGKLHISHFVFHFHHFIKHFLCI